MNQTEVDIRIMMNKHTTATLLSLHDRIEDAEKDKSLSASQLLRQVLVAQAKDLSKFTKSLERTKR